MIQMFHVYKRYSPEQDALHDINLNIEKGDFVFLTGPSGAGKSTLLKLIFYAETPTSGQIVIDGRNISRLKQRQIPQLRRQVGVVFQDFKLIPTLTAEENVLLALEAVGQFGRRARKKVAAMLSVVGLGHKMRAKPLQLSAGEQQRVAIARALINDPKILLADEPTGNLDVQLTQEIMELMKLIHAKGTTVIIATHNQDILSRATKKVLRLKEGKLWETPA